MAHKVAANRSIAESTATAASDSNTGSKNLQKPLTIESVDHLRAWRRKALLDGRKVGCVPTMGALHDGHLSLVRHAKRSCDLVVVSIFVNPSQFAPHEDFSTYPRSIDRDIDTLANQFSDCISDIVVFLPRTTDIYPSGITTDVTKQFGAFVEVCGLSHQMEGAVRPHFFRGVATVVTKLLNLVQPEQVVFGQKDAQQCVIVRTFIRDLCIPVELVVVETVREPNGLAMSSRNRNLTQEEKELTTALYRGLRRAQEAFEAGERSRKVLTTLAKNEVDETKGITFEYLSLAHPYTLLELEEVTEDGAILSGAIRVSKTRIIDNVLLGCQL